MISGLRPTFGHICVVDDDSVGFVVQWLTSVLFSLSKVLVQFPLCTLFFGLHLVSLFALF